jgi:hypothetical protein
MYYFLENLSILWKQRNFMPIFYPSNSAYYLQQTLSILLLQLGHFIIILRIQFTIIFFKITFVTSETHSISFDCLWLTKFFLHQYQMSKSRIIAKKIVWFLVWGNCYYSRGNCKLKR